MTSCGTRPHTATQHLVQQPVVEQDVHGSIWRPYLHGVEQSVPLAVYGIEYLCKIGRAILLDQRLGSGDRFCIAKTKHEFEVCVRRQGDSSLQCTARIKPRAHLTGQGSITGERGRLIQRAQLAEKLGAVAAEGMLFSGKVDERNAISELRAPGIVDK
jgi:hypothetical protein